MKYIIGTTLKILNRQEKIQLTKLFALDLFVSFLDITFLGILLMLVSSYTGDDRVNSSFMFSFLSAKISIPAILGFLVLYSFKNLFAYSISASQHRFFFTVASRLSERNMLEYLRGSYSRFIMVDSSVEIRKISQMPIEFSHYILLNLQQIFTQSMLIIITVAAIFIFHPGLFLLLFLLLVPPIILFGYYLKKKMIGIRTDIKKNSEKTIQHLQESLAGFVESNLFNKERYFSKRYLDRQQQLNNQMAAQQSLQSLPARMVEIFAILGLVILMIVNQLSIGTFKVDVWSVGIFIGAAYKIIPGIVKILNSAGQIKAYRFVLKDLSRSDTPASRGEKYPTTPLSTIQFHQVGFGYQDHRVLKGLDFEISKGDFVGIIGKSGRGKTTVIHLLLGFLAQQEGDILINGKSTSHLDRMHFWERISYVRQQSFFIHDSIVRNICLSEQPYDPVRLEEIMFFCGIDEMIREFPEGKDKVIAENGKNISGGQRKRIMLARALYHDFDLLILDEPFSEMDKASERLLLQRLQTMAQSSSKIIILITHHAESQAFCNQIIHLYEEGQDKSTHYSQSRFS